MDAASSIGVSGSNRPKTIAGTDATPGPSELFGTALPSALETTVTHGVSRESQPEAAPDSDDTTSVDREADAPHVEDEEVDEDFDMLKVGFFMRIVYEELSRMPDLIKRVVLMDPVEQQYVKDEYPLHHAAFIGDVEAVFVLLDRDKAIIKERDVEYFSALHYAAWSGHNKPTDSAH